MYINDENESDSLTIYTLLETVDILFTSLFTNQSNFNSSY